MPLPPTFSERRFPYRRHAGEAVRRITPGRLRICRGAGRASGTRGICRAGAASLALALFGALLAVAPHAAADPGECSSPTGPECSIALSTGVTMRYLQVGPEDGPAAFLLHGYTDTSRSWSQTLPLLQRRLPGMRIIVPDLRGHGASSLPSGADCPAAPENCFRPIDFARDVVAFMDAEHIRRAVMVGHSMGSLVAQELALSFPQRVSRLVLVSSGTDGQQPAIEFLQQSVVQGEWRDAFMAAGYAWPSGVYRLTPGVAAPDFNDFVTTQWVASAVASPQFLDQLRPETEATPLGTWIGALADLVAADNTQRLHQLAVPTLVLWATQDGVFSRDAEQKLIDSLSVAAGHGTEFWWKQYGQLPPTTTGEQTDLAHNLPWEAPAGLAADIASFITDGRPTCTLYRSDYPADPHRVLAEPDRAVVIHGGARTGFERNPCQR
jgi:non-heme chloroperoxidase